MNAEEIERLANNRYKQDEKHGIIPHIRIPGKYGFDEIVPFVPDLMYRPIAETACIPLFSDVPVQSFVTYECDPKSKDIVFTGFNSKSAWFTAQIKAKDPGQLPTKMQLLKIDLALRKHKIPFAGFYPFENFGVLAFQSGEQAKATEIWRTELRDTFDWSLSFEFEPEEVLPPEVWKELQKPETCLCHGANLIVHPERMVASRITKIQHTNTKGNKQ